MTGLIALVGGDEFRPGCEEMDRAILDACGVNRPKLLVVPTAAASENPSKARDNGIAHFSRLGAEASGLMVLGPEHANDEALIAPIDTADVVYFTGGNPAHLLATMSGSKLLEKVKSALDRGAILAGSSAGAMVLGSWMAFGGWSDALGIVRGIAVLPHHERSDPAPLAAELTDSAPDGATVLGIDGMTCCLGSPDSSWRVLGKGAATVYNDDTWRRFTSGETISL